jgi:hypothetical protein
MKYMVSSKELNEPDRTGRNSPQFILKYLMCHDVEFPDSEGHNPTRQIYVTVSKIPDPKSDNGYQRLAAKRHRIPPV